MKSPFSKNAPVQAQASQQQLETPKTVTRKVVTVKRKKPEGQKKSFGDKFLNLALRVTRRPAKYLSDKLQSLREDILKSNMSTSLEGIMAISLFVTILLIPVVAAVMVVFELVHLTLGIFFAPAILALPLLIGIGSIKISESSRSQALDNELPYLIGYITVLAGGGISPIITMKRITKAANIFPAAAREARRILLDVEVFGVDAITALDRAARYTPNKMFAEFIGGYVAVLKTGGDALSYLEAKLKESFGYRESRVKASSEFIGTMAESYIIATVVMGIGFMILFATQNLLSTNAGQIQHVDPTMILLFSGLFVPAISLVFIIVIGSAQIKEPFSYDKQYYVFFGCMPIALVAFFVPFGLPVYMQLGIGLALTSGPAMILNLRFERRKKAVEAKLSNFLRDISEIRKTGLAPEKTIEQLSNRRYGGLSPHVKMIATQLSWGTPIRKVLESFSAAVKSWVARAMTFLLLEVVDVGGGSPKMFINLADFMEKNAQLDRERKSMVRPYVIIPYIGAILVVATTAMMIYFVSAPGISIQGAAQYLPSPAIIQQAKVILLTASFFQAWIMGLVGGKMGESTLGDGFKHATALVILSMLTVIVSGFFVGSL